ncbi:MAG: P-loop NTPase, partial [Nitrososphaerota archaeon]|nr:P-loop NTPase [Nitrososphaerota archaeon]
RVTFTLNLTTPACPLRTRLEEAAKGAVAGLPGVREVVMKTGSVVFATRDYADAEMLKGVKNIIAVASGKGGVGKSTVAVNLAVALAASGARVGILDADVYGPNIPLMMGVTTKPQVEGERIIPPEAHGVKVASLGFFYSEETPVIWRGPLVAGAVRQLLTQVEWGELDYLVCDLPPGTGDSSLTLAQTVPLGGVLIVTTPQDAALNIAAKALAMFKRLNVPILGVVENMSHFVCPHCLPPEQTVITEDGLKPISKVRVGDLVLTHKGRFKKVSALHSHDYEGNLIRITSKSALSPEFQVSLTPDHPVLTRHLSRNKDGSILTLFNWTPAASLTPAIGNKKTDLIAFPRISEERELKELRFVVEYRNKLKDYRFAVDSNLMILLGYYLAEGDVIKRAKRGHCAVRYTFGSSGKELAFAMEVVKAASAYEYHPILYMGKTGWRVEIRSVLLARWIAKEFGTGASTKRVPLWVKLLPPEKLEWLLSSYVNGDGNRGKIETRVKTVSVQLAEGVRDIALKIGYLPSITVRKGESNFQGRKVDAKRIFRVGFTFSRRTKSDGEFVYLRIKKVESFSYKGVVHDLEVEEDNSFCTPYQTVHNCGEKTYIFSKGGGKKIAAERGVDFLGEIPIGVAIREQSDKGVPIVAASPDAPESLVYKELAFRVAGMVSIVAFAKRNG